MLWIGPGDDCSVCCHRFQLRGAVSDVAGSSQIGLGLRPRLVEVLLLPHWVVGCYGVNGKGDYCGIGKVQTMTPSEERSIAVCMER